MPYAFIEENDVLPGEISAYGPDPAVKIQYCRAAYEEVTEYNWAAQVGPKEQVRATLDLLLAHVKGWDLVDKAGNSTAVNEANLRKVPQRIVERMASMVNGYNQDAKAPTTAPAPTPPANTQTTAPPVAA